MPVEVTESFVVRVVVVRTNTVAKRVAAFWTEDKVRKLVDEFPRTCNLKKLCSELGATIHQVSRRARRLGLKRSKDALSVEYARGGWKNKGRKRPDLALNRCAGFGEDNPFFGRNHSDKTKKKLSDIQKRVGTFKRLSKDSEFQRKRLKGLQASPNKPEQKLGEILESLYPGEYKFTGNGDFVIDGLAPDFTNIKGRDKVIEMFGVAYHDPDVAAFPVRPRATLEGRTKVMVEHGYDLLVVWDRELQFNSSGDRQKLLSKIRRFHENSGD